MNKPRRFQIKKLNTRMIITNLVIVMAALLLCGVLIVAVFSTQYLRTRQADMVREAAEINRIIAERYFFKENRRTALSDLRVIARQHSASIWIILRDGGDIWVTDTEGGEWGEQEQAGDIEQHIERAMQGYVFRLDDLFDENLNEPVMTIVRPLVVRGNMEGAIFMHTKLTDIERQIENIVSNVTTGILLAALLALILVPLMARRFTQPLIEMNEVVQSFAKGDFERRLDIRTNDELGELSRSVNAMADDLQALEDMRRSFVANVSHELRSPLTSMRGFLEASMDAPAKERAEYLDIALSETLRLTELVNDLLDLARIESGTIPLKIAPFDINELIRRILITFEGKIDENELEVSVDFERDSYIVDGDRDRISQVIRNLIDNAIKFTPKGGSIAILTFESRWDVFVVVKDSGVGISKEDLSHIWDRFYKVDKAHSTTTVGTGLGLSIVERILDQHGTRIEADSRKGEGTSFSFSLPLSKDRPASAEKGAKETAERRRKPPRERRPR